MHVAKVVGSRCLQLQRCNNIYPRFLLGSHCNILVSIICKKVLWIITNDRTNFLVSSLIKEVELQLVGKVIINSNFMIGSPTPTKRYAVVVHGSPRCLDERILASTPWNVHRAALHAVQLSRSAERYSTREVILAQRVQASGRMTTELQRNLG